MRRRLLSCSPCIQIMTSMVFSAWVQALRVDENPLNPAALPWGDVGGTSEVFKHSYELQAPAQVRDCRVCSRGLSVVLEYMKHGFSCPQSHRSSRSHEQSMRLIVRRTPGRVRFLPIPARIQGLGMPKPRSLDSPWTFYAYYTSWSCTPFYGNTRTKRSWDG